jgi:hypothetical protein
MSEIVVTLGLGDSDAIEAAIMGHWTCRWLSYDEQKNIMDQIEELWERELATDELAMISLTAKQAKALADGLTRYIDQCQDMMPGAGIEMMKETIGRLDPTGEFG